ncbi:helix-turn-helix domain-containing protein [Marimonas lutisalis]|uniref:helix-turn-helix domain-containing protein n=1 Tax=Marimonas lutisalis TaxID=2545756 RepID=UPI0010F5F900|nr:type II toxin-antitoxin system MqsA family antitoxin [Marimonas lutisalis]
MSTALKMQEKIETPTEADDTPDPRAVREKAALDQSQMAELMGMSDFGYSAWERGHRRPGGPAYQLLRLIDADPDRVLKVLAA